MVSELKAMKLPEAAKKVADGIEETLTYCDFPSEHWVYVDPNQQCDRTDEPGDPAPDTGSRCLPGRKFGIDAGLRTASSCSRNPVGQQEIHEYEALGSHGAGATGWISSSQVTKRQGQDKRRTAALDPLRPAC